MNSAKVYRPSQPFLELTTDQIVSRQPSSHKSLAQYYSFVIPNDAQDSIIAVPDGTVDIVFRSSSSPPMANIYGSPKKGTALKFEKGVRYFGARFNPGTANQFLNCQIDQFTEKIIPLREVIKNADTLTEQIYNAPSFEKKIGVFENFFCNKDKELPTPELVTYLLNKINRDNGDIRLQALADETGFSTRYLNNAFKKHVGIAPKLFMRIIRFQRCFGALRSQSGSLNYANLALDAGYYDQAHFINEFKEFSLCTPTQAQCATHHSQNLHLSNNRLTLDA